jgi:hypothetical protein
VFEICSSRLGAHDAESSDWERDQSVGNTTHFVLHHVSIDDFVFGVAAVGFRYALGSQRVAYRWDRGGFSASLLTRASSRIRRSVEAANEEEIGIESADHVSVARTVGRNEDAVVAENCRCVGGRKARPKFALTGRNIEAVNVHFRPLRVREKHVVGVAVPVDDPFAGGDAVDFVSRTSLKRLQPVMPFTVAYDAELAVGRYTGVKRLGVERNEASTRCNGTQPSHRQCLGSRFARFVLVRWS